MDNNFDQEIYHGKTFSDLLKEIHKKSEDRSKQIKMLIDELRPHVKSIGDATVIVPMIKEYLDVDVKNNELLVKMAVIIQRHLQKATTPGSSDYDIPVDEINALMEEYNDNTKKTKKIESDLNNIESKKTDTKETNTGEE